jgi:hypothetical protein
LDAKGWTEKAIDWTGKVVEWANNLDWPTWDLADWIGVIGALLAAASLAWQWYQWKISRDEREKERSSVSVSLERRIHYQECAHLDEDLYILSLLVQNHGREAVVISNVEVHYPGNPPQIAPRTVTVAPHNALDLNLHMENPERILPKRLDPGDWIELRNLTHGLFIERPNKVVVLSGDDREFELSVAEIESAHRWAHGIDLEEQRWRKELVEELGRIEAEVEVKTEEKPRR